ncbi:MAG: isochorismatase family protein, partial [Clostridia bacterium]
MPFGALPVPDGDKIIPVINQMLSDFDLVIFTQDWHPDNSYGFASRHNGAKPFDKYVNKKGNEDTLWPDHCIAGTPGADFHRDLDYGKCKKNFYIFRKGINNLSQGYSGFEDTKLAEFLRSRKVDEVI